MKETTIKLLPGRLLLVAALLFFGAALIAAKAGGSKTSVYIAVGVMMLCIGMFSLRRAKCPK